MLRVLTTTAFSDTDPVDGRVHPFTAFLPLEEIRRRERASVRRFGLPRNVTVHLRLLAHSLLENEPVTVRYSPPADPREYLALYETARSLFGFPQQVVFGPEISAPAELPVEAEQAANRPSVIAPSPSLRRRRPNICSFYISSIDGAMIPLSSIYEGALAAGIGLPPPQGRPASSPRPPEAAPSDRGDLPRRVASDRPGPRPALFGDWLLGPSLFDRLESRGARPVFVQAVFDAFRTPAGPGVLPFAARAFRDKARAYRPALRNAGADCLIFIHAPFSHNRASWGRELVRFGLPTLLLECAVPGYLTEGERIRLENFLARLGT